jgi:hypothetical protein
MSTSYSTSVDEQDRAKLQGLQRQVYALKDSLEDAEEDRNRFMRVLRWQRGLQVGEIREATAVDGHEPLHRATVHRAVGRVPRTGERA